MIDTEIHLSYTYRLPASVANAVQTILIYAGGHDARVDGPGADGVTWELSFDENGADFLRDACFLRDNGLLLGRYDRITDGATQVSQADPADGVKETADVPSVLPDCAPGILASVDDGAPSHDH